jgi:hypothetical protein
MFPQTNTPGHDDNQRVFAEVSCSYDTFDGKAKLNDGEFFVQLAQLYKALGKLQYDLARLAPPETAADMKSGPGELSECRPPFNENSQPPSAWFAGSLVPGWPLSSDVTVSKYNCIFRRCQQCGCSLPPSRGRPPARCIPCKSLAPSKRRPNKVTKKGRTTKEDTRTSQSAPTSKKKISDYGGYWSDASEDDDDFLY